MKAHHASIKYKYFSVMITKDRKCVTELLMRIAIAKSRFNNMRKILSNMYIIMRLTLRLVKCFMRSIFMYGCEACTLDKIMKKRIEVMEMWILRRMMWIPWTARVTNERVREMTGVARELMGAVRNRQLILLGQLLRHDCLEKYVLLGKIEGRRATGRQRKKIATSLMEDVPG